MQEACELEIIREVVGIFDTQENLFDAIDKLTSSGFDRADLSMLAGQKAVEEKLGHLYQKIADFEDDPRTPRIAYVNNESVGEAEGGLIGGLLYIGAVTAMGAVLASGGPVTAAIGAATLVGSGGLLIGTALATLLEKHHAEYFQTQLEHGGLLLWVRVRNEALERKAVEILSTFSGHDIHAHKIALPSQWRGEIEAVSAEGSTADQIHKPDVDGFFDPTTNTITYVVKDPASSHAAIIDPVMDFDPKSGRTATYAADRVIKFVREEGLTVDWILETHAHADHLTAAPYLQKELGGKVAVGKRIVEVQEQFKALFNAEADFATDGSQFDCLLGDGETIEIGSLAVRVMHTPGHTPACSTYVIGDAAFVGDTLFMPDFGTARTDFPGGDAGTLYRSIRKILALPDDTRLFMCHDYGSNIRDDFAWETTVAEERAKNIHINDSVSEADFIDLRHARDSVLDMPVLLFASVQVNMRAGALPPAEANGIRYLKTPLDAI